MKKTIVLLTIVLAFIAAPAFAEVSISGDVDFGWSSDFASPEDIGTDGKDGIAYAIDDVDLDFTGTVDEFTTATFSLEWDGEVIDGGIVNPAEFKVVTDITGAFGIDGAADVSLITGYHDDFSNQSYQIVSRREQEDVVDSDMDKTLVIGADVTVNDMFTVSFGLCPALAADDSMGMAWDTTAWNAPMAMFIGAYTTIDALSAEAWFNMGQAKDWNDDDTTDDVFNSFGLSAAYALPMDGMDFTFGAAFKMDTYEVASDSTMNYAVSAKMVMGALDASVAVNGTGEANDVDSTLGLSMDAGYMVNEIVTVYGGVSFADLMADDMYFTDKSAADDGASANAGAEVGAEIMAGAAKYTVGYQIGSGDINNATEAEGMFIRITTSY